MRALDELAHHEVGYHDKNRRDKLQRREEREVKAQDVREVVLQLAREDAGGEKPAKGAEEVPKNHLGWRDPVTLCKRAGKWAFPEPLALLRGCCFLGHVIPLSGCGPEVQQ